MRSLLKAFFQSLFMVLLVTTTLWAKDNLRETPVVKVVRDNAVSVVNISTERVVLLRESPYWGSYGSEFEIFFDKFFNSYAQTRALKFKSVGSGVIVGQDGVIVTNSHVVNKATNIIVIFSDGTSTSGELMYESPQNDIAIIKITPPKSIIELCKSNRKYFISTTTQKRGHKTTEASWIFSNYEQNDQGTS